METINKGISHTIEVDGLDTTLSYTAILHNAATKKKCEEVGFFIGSKCYFYFEHSVTSTLDVGVYQLNVYDSNKQEMLFNDAYCKVREAGLEG
jgi:hypothetical protein